MTRPARRRLLPTLALPLLLSSCIGMTVDMVGLEPHVYLSGDARGETTALGSFAATTRASWLLWGLVELEEAEPADVVRQVVERGGGDGVVRLEITTQRTFLDSALTLLTLGVYSQRSMKLTGTVVRVSPARDGAP